MNRISHITYSGFGGMTEAVLTLVESAAARSIRHEVIFYGRDELSPRTRLRCQSGGVAHACFRKNPGFDPAALRRLAAHLCRTRPQVVFSHMTQVFPALAYYKIRNPSSEIISIEHHSNDLKTAKDWFLTLANLHLADHTVYLTSAYEATVRAKLRALYRPGKVSIIPNGLDTDRFAPRESPTPPEPFVIGMAARMVDGKDHETLLRAFQGLRREGRLPSIRLQFAGDGPRRPDLERCTAELGVAPHVDFLGDLPQNQLISTMQSWTIFVLSTLGETMSRSLMEAQALGLPIVSTRVGGVIGCVEEGKTGLLVEAQNAGQMEAALLRLAQTPGLRRELGSRARERAVRHYSAGTAWKRYFELAESIPKH